MPSYSVATTKDKLSSLIDKALAGEEVIVTRHGKPTIAFRAVDTARTTDRTQAEWMEWLRERRERLPKVATSYLDLKRMDEEEGAL